MLDFIFLRAYFSSCVVYPIKTYMSVVMQNEKLFCSLVWYSLWSKSHGWNFHCDFSPEFLSLEILNFFWEIWCVCRWRILVKNNIFIVSFPFSLILFLLSVHTLFIVVFRLLISKINRDFRNDKNFILYFDFLTSCWFG